MSKIFGLEDLPPTSNPEYEVIMNDMDRYTNDEKQIMVNRRLYEKNKHKYWKPWVFGFLIALGIVQLLNGFFFIGIGEVLIAYLINAPVAFIINGIQVYLNNELRDMYRINTDRLRMEAKIEEAACFGLAAYSMKTNANAFKESFKPHDLDI